MGMESMPQEDHMLNLYKEKFSSGEWKIMNEQPIELSSDEIKLIETGDSNSEEVKSLLNQKGMEIGKGNFYRIGESIISLDPDDMGTALYSDKVQEAGY